MGLRYTEFPDLYSSTPERTEGDPISTSISLNPEHHPYLVIAWAILLRCYTEENLPIFRVHGDNVLVDTSDFTSPVVRNVTGVYGLRYTGIFDIQAGVPSSQ